jgi:hypothetical protein
VVVLPPPPVKAITSPGLMRNARIRFMIGVTQLS